MSEPEIIGSCDEFVVRELTLTDAPALVRLVGCCPEGFDPELVEFIAASDSSCSNSSASDSSESDSSAFGTPSIQEWLRAYIANQYGFYGYGMWCICMQGSGSMAGVVSIINGSASQVGELSYALFPEYRHKGIAYRACCMALEFAIECGFHSFEVRIRPDNTASFNLAARLSRVFPFQ